MIDAETVLLEELDRLAPFEHIEPDSKPTRRRRSWPGRRVAILVPLAVVVLAVPAITLSADLRSLLGLQLGPNRPVLSKATLVVSAPIGAGYYAHLWQAPGSRSGRCQLVTLDRDSSVSGKPLSANGGGGCSVYARIRVPRIRVHSGTGTQLRMAVVALLGNVWETATAKAPLGVYLAARPRLPAGAPPDVPPYLVGSVYPGLHATRIVLEWHGGSMRLALAHHRFIGGGPQLVRPPYRNLPYAVVAYDASGHEVARKRLLTPQLYLVEGWAAFRAWKANHPHG